MNEVKIYLSKNDIVGCSIRYKRFPMNFGGYVGTFLKDERPGGYL